MAASRREGAVDVHTTPLPSVQLTGRLWGERRLTACTKWKAGVRSDLSSIRDEEDNHVALGDDIKDLPKGSVLLGETASLCLSDRVRAAAETNGDGDVQTSLSEGFANVLSLGGGLRSPSDNTNLLDARKGLGELGILVTASADNVLLGIGKFGQLLLPDLEKIKSR